MVRAAKGSSEAESSNALGLRIVVYPGTTTAHGRRHRDFAAIDFAKRICDANFFDKLPT
ncbi:MAG: hypothetical protein SF187_27135 [Deltaproteobacteria bacterium]|nr:hypothetical protein [Deltaproteobacteria bacterium]